MVEPGEVVLVDGHHYLAHDTPIRLVDDVAAAGWETRTMNVMKRYMKWRSCKWLEHNKKIGQCVILALVVTASSACRPGT